MRNLRTQWLIDDILFFLFFVALVLGGTALFIGGLLWVFTRFAS